jgi:thiol-disulfide isomerase/thioredoxin
MSTLLDSLNMLFTRLPVLAGRSWHGGRVVWALGLFFLLTCPSPAAVNSGVIKTLTLSSGEEITLEVYGKRAQQQILWIASTPGIKPRQRQVAANLAQHDMQIWLVDLAESLFLPHSTETLRNIPPTIVAELINALPENNQTSVLIVSNSYGAIPALRGIHAWQLQQSRSTRLIGVVLFSPNFFTHVPTLGGRPSFIPELAATNVPVYIYQEAKNGNRWHLPAVLEALQQHAPVYTEMLPGVTSMFYAEDQAPETLAVLQTMSDKIQRAVSMLDRHAVPAPALPVSANVPAMTESGLDSQLKPYRGDIQPQPFSLEDANGKRFEVLDFKGKVTVINFWASWCSPCVEEIPSLNRLAQSMQGKAFQLISINYAEAPAHIHKFMRKVAVDFPVLVDPAGKLAGEWRVVAFPSTFVIGPDGKIHYGVNAAIHWDTPDVLQQINQLLEQH